MMRISIGYPHQDDELAILRTHGRGDPLRDMTPACDAAMVATAIDRIRDVHITEELERYVIALCRATRSHPEVELGASPRASLALLRAARAEAAINGRDYVIPDDVKRLAVHVLPHRLILSPDSELAGHTTTAVIDDVVDGVPAPTG